MTPQKSADQCRFDEKIPRIDPLKLLSCLSILLSPNGGIKSVSEVKRLANLMSKYSKKLVSKCIYIQILKSTETELLGQFMSEGGWSLTHLWLQDAITTQNWPLVQEILEMLLSCPVDVKRLRSNTAPRLVKQLTKDNYVEGVRILALKLVEQWLRIVREENTGSKPENESIETSQSPKRLPDSTSIEEEVKPETKERLILKFSLKDQSVTKKEEPETRDEDITMEEEEEAKIEIKTEIVEETPAPKEEKSLLKDDGKKEEAKKERHRSSKSSSSSKHKSSKSSSSSSSSSSKHKSSSSSREKDKHRSGSSSSGSKSKSSSSSSSKSKSSSSSSHKSGSSKSEKKEKVEEVPQSVKDAKALVEAAPDSVIRLGKIPKKPRPSDESKDKLSKAPPAAPKVKPTFSIEERDPEKRASTVKTFNSKFRSHGLEGFDAPIPPPTRKKETESKKSEKSSSGVVVSPPPEKKTDRERSNGIKLIDLPTQKPKQQILVETDLFSEALGDSAFSVSKKKIDAAKNRKRRLSSSKEPSTPTSPSPAAAPLKFYQDTLDDNKEKEDSDESKPKKSRPSLEGEESPKKDSPKEEDSDRESSPPPKKAPGIGTGPDGPPGILKISSRRGGKKKLTWRAQEDLEEVRYFELDETERVNVTKTFVDMQQMDRMQERQSLLMGRKLNSEDTMTERTAWKPLREIDNLPPHPLGKNSKERYTQAEREKTILKALYFNRASIPDAPSEPEFELVPPSDAKLIPLEDETGNTDGINDYRTMPWPEPKGEAPAVLPVAHQPFTATFNNFPTTPAAVSPWSIPPMPAFVNPIVNLPIVPSASPFVAGPHPQPPFVDPMIMNQPPVFAPTTGPSRSQGRDWVRGNADRYSRHSDRRGFDDRRGGGGDRRGVCHVWEKYGNCKRPDCQYYHPR